MLAAAAWLAFAAAPSLAARPDVGSAPDPASVALLNRVTWGVDASDVAEMSRLGPDRWLEAQLHPTAKDRLPPPIQAQIDAMPYLTVPVLQLVVDAQAQNAAANGIVTPPLKSAAKQVYNKALEDAVHQAALRSVLRDIYSPDQLKEQMTWFWFNHFNVHQYKANLRLLIGDYEEQALRPHALGRFRDLLEADLRHPAMLRYLDNANNAAGRINENYAREIMELHTMGVGSGYSQQDVQELARILTGVEIDDNPKDPQLAPDLRGQLIRSGLFEFNPARHDYGDKMFLGHAIRGRGFGEVEQALDILCRQPATARHISQELATYFVSDTPPGPLVQRMSQTFMRSDGDIAQVLGVMFASPEFKASLGTKFKDPAHYAISAARLAYGDKPILNAAPILSMLNRMGEGLYAHETPDGYAMVAASWNGPGQLETRFELARQLGSSGAGLFRAEGTNGPEPPTVPSFAEAVRTAGLESRLSPATQSALAQAGSPAEWNSLFLSSPDFMRR